MGWKTRFIGLLYHSQKADLIRWIWSNSFRLNCSSYLISKFYLKIAQRIRSRLFRIFFCLKDKILHLSNKNKIAKPRSPDSHWFRFQSLFIFAIIYTIMQKKLNLFLFYARILLLSCYMPFVNLFWDVETRTKFF